MNIIEKLNLLDTEMMTDDEVFEAWGTTETEYLEKMMEVVNKENKKAKTAARKAASQKAAAGKAKRLLFTNQIKAIQQKEIKKKENAKTPQPGKAPKASAHPLTRKAYEQWLTSRRNRTFIKPESDQPEPQKISAFGLGNVEAHTSHTVMGDTTSTPKASADKTKRRRR